MIRLNNAFSFIDIYTFRKNKRLKFHDKGFNATEIFHILKEIFEDDSLAYSSITYHLRKKSWTVIPEEAKNRGSRPANFRIDSLILQELNSDPILSCH